MKLEIGSIISARTKSGMVDLTLREEDGDDSNELSIQMDLNKAREVRSMLDGAIEAAVSDELIWKFLSKKIGLSDEACAKALLDLRELRQGSRETVFPT